jgi:hypothetical protein
MAMNALAVLLANIVNRADVRVVEGGCSLGFALEAGERLWVTGNIVGQELESDEAMETQVFRLVHDAHATAAEFLDYAVMRDCLVDH